MHYRNSLLFNLLLLIILEIIVYLKFSQCMYAKASVILLMDTNKTQIVRIYLLVKQTTRIHFFEINQKLHGIN